MRSPHPLPTGGDALGSKKGELLIGCHVPGHWAAGMRGTLEVG